MPVNNPSKYPLRVNAPRKGIQFSYLRAGALLGIIAISGLFLLPQVITLEVINEQTQTTTTQPAVVTTAVANSFPISVNPATKSIVDNPQADAFFKANRTPLTAAVGNVGDLFSWIASLIDNTALYQSLAGADGHLISVRPGYRKEEVLSQLTNALHWTKIQQQQFSAAVASENSGIPDGIFAPGNYVVDTSMTPASVAALMNVKFGQTILSHYSTTTASTVPLSDALTVASMLEREASGSSDIRIISGIIWNRLFNNMNLQIDATLQYAKGENRSGNWWQKVVPADKFIKSPYNTYAHAGLPPGPIANPSVASVLAALNPVPTSCLYYFHDARGVFHCSKTYAQHVALLKKYYGQGK
ncbi:endolytic transglycosylase MltG [Patescibacteria group bacterium]|nr:endolytic transglycosylase MltG [Patescibacteria group bacterium]